MMAPSGSARLLCAFPSGSPQARLGPTALGLLAFARTFVPSAGSFPKCANPILRATRTTSTNGHLKPCKCQQRNPQKRAVARKFPRTRHPERHVLLRAPRNPTRREHPRRIPVRQNLHHHPGLVRRIAPTVALIRRVENRQVRLSARSLMWCARCPSGSHSCMTGAKRKKPVRLVGAERRRHRTLSFGSRRTTYDIIFFCGAGS